MSDPTRYDPHTIEPAYYKIWEERGYFELDGNRKIQKEGRRFAIMMPPPNVTGRLHIGHALTFTLQDIIVRYKRMDGFETLWQPGTDHAGIATQNVVERQLLARGIKKEELGREAFLQHVWRWKEESGNAIVSQLRMLGVSPAWSRERFTMDEGLKNAVRKAFVQLYEEGLIVKGNYMVNWCTHDGALSDIEVEYEEREGALYYIRYPLVGEEGHVVVATTRPETYFGDTAVMVNPADPRYKGLVGKRVKLPLIDREIPIIADEHVDMEFGTGVVKVTPAHDPNDYEVGKRHNLPSITIFDEQGILNDHAGPFAGMERLEARERIVQELDRSGFLEKVEPHTHQVGHCYRCGNVIEPYISTQWFVKKEIAKEAIEAANAGETRFFPPQWLNNYNAWMRELRDWCISRQLWWGHRIPVWYCRSCGHEWASEREVEESCPKCASQEIYQDPDVLDTWFSSALWPFSTLGWGNGEWGKGVKWMEDDLEKFYPNSLLITGFDILFFWVARMMMMGKHFLGKLPFRDVYLHALVRDKEGRKMAKSLGNVIDPVDTIQTYSADALRFTLAALAVQGRDIRLSQERLELSRNFTNKLYNAARFLLMHHDSFADFREQPITTELGRYMASRLAVATREVRENLEGYRFNDGAMTLYRFLWGEFCDWGIELAKAQREAIPELGAIFKEAMKLLHPFMPFITEHLYQLLSGTSLEESESIMVQPYPEGMEQDRKIEEEFAQIIDAIVSIRRAKGLIDRANRSIPKVFVRPALPPYAKEYIRKLAKVEEVHWTQEAIPQAIADIGEQVEIFIPLEGIDLSPIIERLRKQQEKSQKEIQKLEKLLSNQGFLAKAPEEVVAQNQQALTSAKERLAKIEEELRRLGVEG
ncbi:MAG: valine--tRNA ligase [Nitratiruptor sp.]|nr:valine--tRNA ligase [Nitratiruptor sp.]NPA83295.1 valine--tRNA ligase [Campylobacterota bacterium]